MTLVIALPMPCSCFGSALSSFRATVTNSAAGIPPIVLSVMAGKLLSTVPGPLPNRGLKAKMPSTQGVAETHKKRHA
jgi:hypothetical protein